MQFENRKLALLQKPKENKRILRTFHYTIPPSSAKFQANPHARLAFNRATTIAQRNLQRPAPHMLQKKAVNQRYTRES